MSTATPVRSSSRIWSGSAARSSEELWTRNGAYPPIASNHHRYMAPSSPDTSLTASARYGVTVSIRFG